MGSTASNTLPGGEAKRTEAAGLASGAPFSYISGPKEALGMVAEQLVLAEQQLMDFVHSDVAAVSVLSRYLLQAGGKRLRPALTALGARALGKQQSVTSLMCVGELIHLGSLLHDDVVDNGAMRRGYPTANRIFGNAVSVLSGDYCLARAMQIAAEHGGYAAVTALSHAVTKMAEGEVLQLQRMGNVDCGYEEYMEVVERKSAALISWCVAASAYQDEDSEMIGALEGFGFRIGTAFQITDDVLDFQEGTGKPRGTDLRERKVTLPLLYAMDTHPELREELRESDPAPERVVEIVDIVVKSGALKAAIADARKMVRQAVEGISVLPDTEGRSALTQLGYYLVERTK